MVFYGKASIGHGVKISVGITGILELGENFTINSFFYFLFFSSMIIFSILCDLFNNYLITSDLYEIVKPFAFLLFFTFYRQSSVKIDVLEENTLDVIVFIFLILAIYSLLEFIFPDMIRPVSFFLYKRESVRILTGMMIGSFNQTYQFAYILLLPLIYSLISLLKNFSFKYFIMFLLYFFVFLLTQSRSMYIALAISISIIFCLPPLYSTVKSSIRVISIILILFLLLIGLYIKYQNELEIMLSYAFNGLEAISEGSSRSANGRMDQIKWAVENNNWIILGAGISKNIHTMESFYGLYYYRYGLLGITIYLLIPVVTAIYSYKIATIEYRNRKISCFYLSLFVFYIVTPVGILSSCHQDTPKISFLFYGLIGLVFNKYYNIKNKT
jgi:hypothetical protein